MLLAELIDSCICALKLTCEIILYTDSMITLTWIQGCPSKWKTFVANRVAKIQELVLLTSWNHVSGVENPADLASRGISSADLLKSKLWWHGPNWLLDSELPMSNFAADDSEAIKEAKLIPVLVGHATNDSSILTKFSSYKLLLRTTTYILRFKFNCLHNHDKITGELTPGEINNALFSQV